MTKRTPQSPGERLTEAVSEAFELDEHELLLLGQAAATADHIEELERVVARDGVIVSSPQGDKAHPALVEVRQQRITLARLLAALRVPSGDEDERRPQRRSGVRGVYGLSAS